MSISEVTFNRKGEQIPMRRLDDAVNSALQREVVHTSDTSDDLLERVRAFPHMTECDPVDRAQGFILPARVHYVVAVHPDVVENITCRLDQVGEKEVASDIKITVWAGDSINDNPALQVGHAARRAFRWTKTPQEPEVQTAEAEEVPEEARRFYGAEFANR